MRLTDIAPYSGYDPPVYHRYLEYVGANDENKSGKSDKYWEVAVFANRAATGAVCDLFLVVRRWGKYGTKGTIKPEEQWSEWSAIEHAREMKAKKRAKGYTKEIDVITRLGMKFDEDAA